ncbi:MAG: hypothetical protein ABSC29_01845 [Minisyncoccia bacterium]
MNKKLVAILMAVFFLGAIAYLGASLWNDYNSYRLRVAALHNSEPAPNVDNGTQSEEPNKLPPMYSVVNPSRFPLSIVNYKGHWVALGKEPTVPNIEWRYGSGESFLMRSPAGGRIDEVYEGYCVSYNEQGDCKEKKTLVARSRWVRRGQLIRVVSGAIVQLEGRAICRPVGDSLFRATPVEELRDPSWKPREVVRKFASVDELRHFAQERGQWIVVGSKLGAPLFGYRHPGARVYAVEHERKQYYAFGLLGKKKPTKPLEGCAALPIHVGYRYLPLGVGHDAEYGPGCVSIFGFGAGSDVRDMHNVRMAILSRGEAWYYGDPAPKFRLEAVQ